MQQEDLFSMALGIFSPWYIESISLDTDKGELNIHVDFAKGSEFEYTDKETGEHGKYKAYDSKVKTWRHMNFFQYRCYLHARIPRVDLGNGSIKQVQAPWEGKASGFTLLFEALLLELSKVMPVHQVSKMTGIYDNKIWKMLGLYVDECREDTDHSEVKRVGIDETAARRGHDYVTLFVDLDQRKTLYVAEGRNSDTITSFAEELESHHGKASQIEQVSCDMSPAFIKGINKDLPNAEITFDKFHIVKIINEAIDRVRREERMINPILKNSRYVFMKNRSNYTVSQQAKYEEIKLSKLNIRTFKALQIRESFQQIYQSDTVEEFTMMLQKWYFWATHSRIYQIKEVAKMIKKHWSGIINWAISRINNGILEGFNSVFQAAKAKARGYKRTSTIKTIIYLLTGKFDFSKVNSFASTHSLL